MNYTPSSVVTSLVLSLTLFISVEAAALGIGCDNGGNNKESLVPEDSLLLPPLSLSASAAITGVTIKSLREPMFS